MQILTLPETTVKQILNYVQLTPAQRDLMARYGIRAAAARGTMVIARRCKCGAWQDYERDMADTYRNRWEIQHAFEKLSGDDWRCATCRIPHTVKDVVSAGGSGNGGSGRTHSRTGHSRSGNKAMTKRETERRIEQLTALINAYPNSERVEDWKRELGVLRDTLANWKTRKRKAA